MDIKDYLLDNNAVGIENAITTKEIKRALYINTDREVVRRVSVERSHGALICGKQTGDGGYYMPANIEEIQKQAKKLEKGFKMRALAIKPFRRALQDYKAGKTVLNE